MANPKHLEILKQGVEAWNQWRKGEDVLLEPDLSGADLSGAKLQGADLGGVNLDSADLRKSTLWFTNLSQASLSFANLTDAELIAANLGLVTATDRRHSFTPHGTRLVGATLTGAQLMLADLTGAVLRGADLAGATFGRTSLCGSDLAGAHGLYSCKHQSFSYIDHGTLVRSGQLPIEFLRGCGLPDSLIDYLPSLLGDPIQFYSCFISYSSKNQDFAERLHTDLQNKGVRCWYAPQKVRGGEYLHEQIDRAIHFHDRLLLVLSPDSMDSEWVKLEIRKALEREQQEDRRVLFPISLVPLQEIQRREWIDGKLGKDLIEEICKYYIPDFTDWKEHDAYQMALDRLIRDLKPEAAIERRGED